MKLKTLFVTMAVAFCGLLGASVVMTGAADLFLNVGRNPDGPGNENWKAARWLGDEGRGMADRTVKDPADETVLVYRLEGGGSATTVTDNRTVFWLNRPEQLKADMEYVLKARLKTENVAGRVGLVAAVRAGGLRDVRSENLSGTRDWTEISLHFKVTENCRPRFFMIDLWGLGSVWVGKIQLLEKEPKLLDLVIRQDIFNLADRVARINVRIGIPEPAGLNIRFTTEIDGKNLVLGESEVTGPNIDIQIDISGLQAGNHVIWAALQNNDRVLARERVVITKTAGLLDF